MPISANQLISAAISQGLIDAETVEMLRRNARREHISVLDALTTRQQFPMLSLYHAWATEHGIPYLASADLHCDRDTLHKLHPTLLVRKRILPQGLTEGVMRMAIADPTQLGLQGIEEKLGTPVEWVMAEAAAIMGQLKRHLTRFDFETLAEAADPTQSLDLIMREAWLRRASDIHIEPIENGVWVRFRVDGQLQDFPVDMSAADATGLISRIKVLAEMDIAEQRQPQDGGFDYQPPMAMQPSVETRIATVPIRWGEKVTIRLLNAQQQILGLRDLGFGHNALACFSNSIRLPYGMILLTGPTGSGKSTTLYAALKEINAPDINIMTVEDPIESYLPGITQVQAGGQKLSFAQILRSFLRHDPDVMMVGEIRDDETADVAMKAAMTGHLVFSTLHTNSAASAITRLVNIGCERFLLSDTLLGVVAQRLVKRLCQHCKQARTCTPSEQTQLHLEAETTLYDANGCLHCQNTGYSGRVALFETLWVDHTVQGLIAQQATAVELIAQAPNYQSLQDDGLAKVLAGTTTLSEVHKVTFMDR